jgi:FAD/FMN-containing dehydrogenase/Fe-S oxidoreductase
LIDLITGIERARLHAIDHQQPPPGDRPDQVGDWHGDATALAAALRDKLDGEVRFDAGSLALYATDASNYRQVPIGVVIPRSIDDVVAAVETARAFGAPILARGGGTSLAGECCNVAVVLDFSKFMNRVLEVNVEERWARVEPGVVLDALRNTVLPHGLTYVPDPATHSHNTLGGMIGNNSCGMHAQMAGKVEENILELDVLTYDGVRLTVGATTPEELAHRCDEPGRPGEIYRDLRDLRDEYADRIRARFPNIPRRVSGYNLNELLPESGFDLARALVGTECTCALVLGAKVKLIPNPNRRVVLVLAFKDIYAAGDAVPHINAQHNPIALEGFDDRLLAFMNLRDLHTNEEPLLPAGGGEAKGWLMCEYGTIDDRDGAIAQARACEADVRSKGAIDSRVFVDEGLQERLWLLRESALGASAKVPGYPPFHPGWEDSAVPPERIGPYLRDLRALYDAYEYDAAFYGHLGQGCIHSRVDFRLSDAEGVATWKRFMLEAAELIRRYGGSLSGEHGDGQARGPYLSIMYGEEIVEAFRHFKRIWDPQWMMNPGKVVDAYPVDANLREGPYYRPAQPETRFSFEVDDRGSFAYAANRCVGVGKCRSDEKGTMCPSYRVTREEQHSTRGRARLLFEMLEGNPLTGGWRSEAVKDALDLCLACKGCKGECPVNVDMATYKAEFLSHYYEGKRRPVWAYAFGLIMYWGHVGSLMPRVVNALTQTPGFSHAAKALVKMAPERRIPPLSAQSFRAWWRERGARPNEARNRGRVILWADTFNNYFHSTTARHALSVLETAGYDVIVPETVLCCGRPLYDYGMIDLGKILLREIIDTLRPEIERGTPIVGLEPSCVSVFRDELRNLFPNDPEAARLSSQTMMFGEFLARDKEWSPPRLERKALVHGHCHHKSLLGTQPDEEVMKKMGLEARWLDDGCCGMAGAFGFEAGEHYDVSLKVGELGYLPAVREAAADTLLISDGFSCREQVMQTTDRQVLHFADVVWLAMNSGPHGTAGPKPERHAMPDIGHRVARARVDAAIGFSVLGALAFGYFTILKRHKGKQ